MEAQIQNTKQLFEKLGTNSLTILKKSLLKVDFDCIVVFLEDQIVLTTANVCLAAQWYLFCEKFFNFLSVALHVSLSYTIYLYFSKSNTRIK